MADTINFTATEGSNEINFDASGSVSNAMQFIGTVNQTGPQGESAYQAWLDQGNVGTEADFIESLKGEPGTDGINGTNGTNGQGVPTGGTANQALTKIDGTDYNTQWVTLTKSSVGLGNVDNTSDANKPVSTAQQAALDLKANDTAVLHTTGNESATGTKTFANMVVAASSGDAVLINGIGSANSLARFQDDGTERGAIFSLNGNSEFVVRSQARLALISNNSGTPKYIYSDLGAFYSTSGMDLGSNSNMWVNGYITTLNSTSINTTNLRVGTSTTSGYVLTADSSGNATWQAATGGGGGGGITRAVTNTSGNFTAGSTAGVDYIYLITANHTPTLPTAVGNTNRYTFKNKHSANITFLTTSGQTVDGGSLVLGPSESVDLISDNTNWNIL